MVDKPRLENLFGQNSEDLPVLAQLDGSKVVLHKEVVAPFQVLQQAALADGISLVAVSGYRSYDRQLAIWNEKMTGKRPLLDEAGNPVNAGDLSESERIFAILRWSALPAASRHHWGTDLDVIDSQAMPQNYRVQLLPCEYSAGGIFERLGCWLEQKLSADDGNGFFCPYRQDLGGIAPEPWHISYGPIARLYQQQLTIDVLRQQIEGASLLGKQIVLQNLEEIYTRFIAIPDDS